MYKDLMEIGSISVFIVYTLIGIFFWFKAIHTLCKKKPLYLQDAMWCSGFILLGSILLIFPYLFLYNQMY